MGNRYSSSSASGSEPELEEESDQEPPPPLCNCNKLPQNMGNGGSSDSSSGSEHEEESEQGPPSAYNTFDGYSLLPLEVRVKILSKVRMFKTVMSLLWADRSLYEYCCNHEVLSVESILVSTKEKDGATVRITFYEDDYANVDGDWFGSKSDFVEMHKLPHLPVRGQARDDVPPGPKYGRLLKDFEKRLNKHKLSIRHVVKSQHEEGFVYFKSKQLMFNGSVLSSVYAVYDLGTLVLDAPCVPPPTGPPIKCYKARIHWDFGYLKKWNREVDTEDLFNKWIEHVQPTGALHLFLHSKIAKEDLIALCSRKWGNISILVCLKKWKIPVDHVGDMIDVIPLETRDFALSVRAHLTCDLSIETQLTKRIQHFIDTNGEYKGAVYFGAKSFDVDVDKIRRNLVIPSCPEFCIAEDHEVEFEFRIRHNKSRRYISLQFERKSLDDRCAIRVFVDKCKCDPKLEHGDCEHGVFMCDYEEQQEAKEQERGAANTSRNSAGRRRGVNIVDEEPPVTTLQIMGNEVSSGSTSGSELEEESENEQELSVFNEFLQHMGSDFLQNMGSELLQNMENGGSSDSDGSSGSEHEEESEQGQSFCNTFDGYLLLPLEVRVKILSQIRKFRTKMSLLWADRSLYEYCCRHEVLTVESILVGTKEKDDATVKVSFYEHDGANLDDDWFGPESDFIEMHKLPEQAVRARHEEVEKGSTKNKLSIRHFVKSHHEEGFVTFKSKQLMFNGSFLSSARAIGDLRTLVLDAPCVPPPAGPLIKCHEVQMHWDFGYLKKLNREVDTEGLFIKWIEHVQPTGALRLFLFSKVAKEDLIALCSRKWGDVSLVVCLRKMRMPVEHVGEMIDVIPLETRDFVLCIRAHLACESSIETQLIKRLQHFINMNGDYEADVYIGAKTFYIDVDKIRRSIVVPCGPEFCIVEDKYMEFEFRIRHNESGRYISLQFERKSLDDPCAIRLRVGTCKCDPKLEQDGCEHGFCGCGDEEQQEVKEEEC